MHYRTQTIQSGLTLIEAIIAMVLLAIVSTSLTVMNGGLFKHAGGIEETKQGSLMVQSCVDRIIATRKVSGVSALEADALQTACRNSVSSLNTDIALYVTLSTQSLTCPTSACTGFVIQAKSIATSWKTEPATLFFANY